MPTRYGHIEDLGLTVWTLLSILSQRISIFITSHSPAWHLKDCCWNTPIVRATPSDICVYGRNLAEFDPSFASFEANDCYFQLR